MRKATMGVALCVCLMATMAVAQDKVSLIDNRAVVYLGPAGCTNGGPAVFTQTPTQVNGFFSDADCGICGTGAQAIADTFTLGADTLIDQVNVWGGYFPADIQDNEPFNVVFHANAAGLPGSNENDQSVVATSQVPTGVVLFGVSEILVVLDIAPFNVTAGTHHLEVTTNTVGNPDSYFWETGTGPGLGSFAFEVPGVTWMSNGGNGNAFILCESVIPVELMSYDVE